MRIPLAAVAALSLVAGCGREKPIAPTVVPGCTALAPSATGPGDTENLFPLAAGNTRIFRAIGEGGQFTFRESVLAGTMRDGATVFPVPLVSLDPLGSSAGGYFSNGPSGIAVHAAQGYAGELAGAYPHVTLRWPLVAGDRYRTVNCTRVGTGQDLDGDGVEDTVSFYDEVTVDGIEPVRHVVGVREAWKVTTREHQRFFYSSGLPPLSVVLGQASWFAPGLGRVRTQLLVDEPPVATREELLIGWSFPGVGRRGVQELVGVRATGALEGGATAHVAGRSVVVWSEPDRASPGTWRLLSASIPEGASAAPAPAVVATGFAGPVTPRIAGLGDRVLVTVGAVGWRLGADGQRLDPEAGLALGGTEEARPLAGSGAWTIVAQGPEGFRLRRLSLAGVLDAAVTVPGTAAVPGAWAAAWTGEGYLLAWFTDGVRPVALRVSAAGAPLDAAPRVLATDGTAGWISTAGGGGAGLVAWDPGRGVRVDAAGQLLDATPMTLGSDGVDGAVTFAYDGARFIRAWDLGSVRVDTVPLDGATPALSVFDGFEPGFPVAQVLNVSLTGLDAPGDGDVYVTWRREPANADVVSPPMLYLARVAF